MIMDLHRLLYAAQKNEVTKDKSKARYYPSSFAPPKKEEKSKGLSVNVKKFLARKEEEEKQKKIEEERKREALLQLRNQDNKAKKRVQVMLKRTKSYNKSVIEDAIDQVNTADTMNGPQQCDEDDYGYVSQEASALYSKMMEKYGSVPSEDNKFSKKRKSSSSDLLSTKDRVKMALQRQEEEEMGPHKRKRKKKDDDDKGDNEEEDEPEKHSSDKDHSKEKEKEEKPKPKRLSAPPPLNFTELLKIAEKKQYEPPPLEIKLKEAKRQQPKEPERLMTKKEKLEYERSRDKRLQREPGTSSDSIRESNSKTENKLDKREKEREDERKKVKEQKVREEERYRRQREAERDQERRRQEDREQEKRRHEDREQERRRLEDRERERRRLEDRERERRRLEDRERERRRLEDRERERRRLEDREQEKRREEDRERQRERDRIRELEEELERRKEKERLRELEEELARRKEKERLREQQLERREKDRKLQHFPKKIEEKSVSKASSSSFLSKPKEVPGKALKNIKPNSDKPTLSKDYRNGEVRKRPMGGSEKINSLFGDRDSASPDKSSSKPEKPKPRPVERIKINNASSATVDDLFGDDVTIRMKQKPVPNASNNKITPNNNDRASPGLKTSQPGSKLGRDDPRKDKPNPDRKRPSDFYPDKSPRPADSRLADRPALNGRLPIKKEFPPKDLKPRQFPPPDVKSRQFPPPDVRSRQFPTSHVAGKGSALNRRFEYERRDSEDSSEEDEDDEYDSELDDFIDDGPQEDDQANVSSCIKEIFGYDKSRYANIDDRDEECMESNYAQVMREEKTSARIGLMEDIEDMKKEEMEKRLKAMRKTKQARR